MTQQTSTSGERPSLFKELASEIRDRTKKPAKHPSFIVFFLIAVLGFGALGIWLELYVYVYPDPAATVPLSSDALRTAILTFFPAVAGTAAMQLIWAESTKHFRSAAFLVLALFLVMTLVLFPARISNGSALFFGVAASILSLWVWWIANAKQVDLLDALNPTAAVGGEDAGAPLPGSLSDYEH